tara:strand:- start:409 stop:1833 length:1425 start_codon:yes stop_codon:yes gene_type:complete
MTISEDYEIKKICCIGAGYVGGPTMAVIADKCPNLKVTVLDINQERINQWNHPDLDKLPVYEPGLKDVINRVRGKNLFFSTQIEKIIADSEMIFISVNTPTKIKGFGAGYASDLKWVEASARQVAKHASNHTIVVEKSTLPVKTAQLIKNILQDSSGNNFNQNTFTILSNPEFLAEGTAINDLKNPDRVLIGGDDLKSINALKNIYKNWVPENKIISTNLWSSELSKLTANAFLAQRISSINSISAICEATGAEINEVSIAIGCDKRIGSNFLAAGPGFGGSCFKKDILNLVYLSKHYGLNEVAEYWEQIIKINDWQKKRISKLIVEKLFGTVSQKKIAILGFAFKANTNDTRESPTITIVNDLIENGAQIIISDPKVSSDQISKDLNQKEYQKELSSELGYWMFSRDIYEAVINVDAIVILTEWDEYKKLDWKRISKKMRSPSWVFDARSIANKKEIKKAGINFWSTGDGSSN